MIKKDVRANPPDSVTKPLEVIKYRELYDDITSNGVSIQYHQREALGQLAICLVDMTEFRRDISENGVSMKVQGDRHVITKKNPACDELERCRNQSFKLFKEFKMTPGSMGKILSGGPASGGIHTGEVDDFDEI